MLLAILAPSLLHHGLFPTLHCAQRALWDQLDALQNSFSTARCLCHLRKHNLKPTLEDKTLFNSSFIFFFFTIYLFIYLKSTGAVFPEWATIRVASTLPVSLALSLRPRAQPVQSQDDLCPWGYRLHSFPAVLKHTYYLCSWHVSLNTNECEKVSDITVRYFAKKSSLVLLCPPSVAALGVCVATSVRISMVPAHLPLALDPGNEHSNPGARGHCRGTASLVCCLRVSNSKCLRKEYNNIEIQYNLFYFLSSQTLILREVLPTPSEMFFPCLMFLYYKTNIWNYYH